MPWVDPTQQLTFIEAEPEGVVCLPGPWFPRRFLTGEHDGQAIQIGDHAPIDGLIDREESRLMGEQLADGYLPLPRCANSAQYAATRAS